MPKGRKLSIEWLWETHTDSAEMFRPIFDTCSIIHDRSVENYKPFFSGEKRATYWNNLATMRQLNPTAEHFRRLHLRIDLKSLVYDATNMLAIHSQRHNPAMSIGSGGTLRTNFSVDPEYDPVQKTYDILHAWIIAYNIGNENVKIR